MDYFLRRDLRYRTSAAAPPPSARSVSVAGSGDPTIGRGSSAVVGVCAATDAVKSSDARIVAGPSHRVMLLFHSLMVECASASGCLRIRRLLLGVAPRSNLPARSARRCLWAISTSAATSSLPHAGLLSRRSEHGGYSVLRLVADGWSGTPPRLEEVTSVNHPTPQ